MSLSAVLLSATLASCITINYNHFSVTKPGVYELQDRGAQSANEGCSISKSGVHNLRPEVRICTAVHIYSKLISLKKDLYFYINKKNNSNKTLLKILNF